MGIANTVIPELVNLVTHHFSILEWSTHLLTTEIKSHPCLQADFPINEGIFLALLEKKDPGQILESFIVKTSF